MEHFNTKLKSGLNIHTLACGNDKKQAIVLLHGYPANAYLWRNIMPMLSKHFYLLAPDLPGHGTSSKPMDKCYTLEFFIEFLKDYFEVLNLRNVYLVGHDLGGTVALGYTTTYPDHVSKLVIMDTAPYINWSPLLKTFLIVARNQVFAGWLLLPFVFRIVLKYLAVYSPKSISKKTAEIYRKPWVMDQNSRKAFSKVIEADPAEITPDRNQYKNIKASTLILWSENDPLFSLRIAGQLKKDIPKAKLISLPNCSHFLQEDNPVLIAQHLIKFLDLENSNGFLV
jgi:pimeloyl-ACP methyl ester carboxylesterase